MSEFWTVFAGVICANLLTVCFVWGAITYSRHEREGTDNSRDAWTPFVAMMMPMLFAAAGVMTALDKVPAWLDAISK